MQRTLFFLLPCQVHALLVKGLGLLVKIQAGIMACWRGFPFPAQSLWVPFAVAFCLSSNAGAQTTFSSNYTYAFTNVVPVFEAPAVSAGYIDRTSASAYPPANAPAYVPANPDRLSWKRVCGDTNINGDDDSSGPIPFPAGFQFTFGNPAVAYSAFRVGANGSIQFSNVDQAYAPIYTPSPLPYLNNGGATGCNSAGGPTNVLYAYWRDLTISPFNSTPASGPVRFELRGTAPNRRFIVTWDSVRQYGVAATNFTFQIALFESPAGINGDFEYRYLGGVTNGLGATIGVQVNGTDWFSYNPSTNNTAANAPIDITTGTTVRWSAISKPSELLATYRFQEASYNGTASEVSDSSGLGNHAASVGGVNTGIATGAGAVCSASNRVARFPNGLAATARIQTNLALSNIGSVSFFYQRNTAWNDGVAAMLFSASAAGAPFHLIKTGTGALQLSASPNATSTAIALTTANQTFAANTRQHIGISWVFLPGLNQTYVQVFLNGTLINNSRFTYNVAPYPNPITNWFNSTRTIAIGGSSPAIGGVSGPNGDIDDFRVYSQQINTFISNADLSCVPLVNYVQLSASPSSVGACQPTTITVRACANAACTATYNSGLSGTLSATPSSGVVWGSGSGAFVTGGSGTATNTLIVNTAGANTTIALSGGINPLPANAAPVCTFGNNAPTNNNCVIAVSSSSSSCVADFNCVRTGSDSATGTLFTKVAGTAFSFDVVARRQDGTVLASFASDTNKTVSVELVDGSGATACASRTALAPAVIQNLTFTTANQATEQGRKSITFTLPNAYNNLRCRVTDSSVTPNLRGCSTDNFAVRPPLATLSTAPSMAAPPGANTANPIKAGASFNVSVNTASGANYAPALTLNTNSLSAQLTSNVLTQQSGGAVGALAPSSLTINAAAIAGSYSEVGYLYLAAGAYYDAASPAFTAVDSAGNDCESGFFDTPDANGRVGCGIGSVAAAFGRFIPDRFATTLIAATSPTRPLACPSGATCPTNASGASGLVYANQPFALRVTAQNAAGNTTTNYQNSFAKASTLTAWNARGATGAANENPGAGALANASIANTAFANGVATLNDPSYGTTLPTLLNAANVFVRATESVGDGVTSLLGVPANSVEAGVRVASARIVVANAYGSERSVLPVPFTVQYRDAGSWRRSATDSTTSFNSALTSNGGNLTSTAVAGAANCIAVSNPATLSVSAGTRSVLLTASGPCSYNISLASMPIYLPIAPANGGRVTFGIFKSPLIYQRENY